MSESNIMFNERDQRCAAVQLMLSADQSYVNRIIASTLKLQIRTVQRLRAQLNASDDLLEVVERKDTARKTRTKEFIEKVQAIIDETPQRPIRKIVWDLGISHTTVNACVRENLNCKSYMHETSQILTEKTKNLRLIKSVGPPPPPTWTCWTTSFGHTSRTLPTWLPQHQSQPDCRHLPSIRRAPAGACGKGMLLVPDPYRGGDWGYIK